MLLRISVQRDCVITSCVDFVVVVLIFFVVFVFFFLLVLCDSILVSIIKLHLYY